MELIDFFITGFFMGAVITLTMLVILMKNKRWVSLKEPKIEEIKVLLKLCQNE